ncbi:hypothetical protein BD413DRAFT_571768 [Trametes elegans]|nr:hypothetical protein BD413DRAFT_571768 [Trametes elegans]
MPINRSRSANWYGVYTKWTDGVYSTSLNLTELSENSEGPDASVPHLRMHRVLSRVSFRPEPSEGYYGVSEDAQLCPRTDSERALKESGLLRDHPLLERSFATSVPVNRRRLDQVAGRELRCDLAKRSTGVTVLDFANTVHCEYVLEF